MIAHLFLESGRGCDRTERGKSIASERMESAFKLQLRTLSNLMSIFPRILPHRSVSVFGTKQNGVLSNIDEVTFENKNEIILCQRMIQLIAVGADGELIFIPEGRAVPALSGDCLGN